MTTPIVDLTLRLDSPNVHRPLQATTIETTSTTTIIHPPPPQLQQSTTNSMLMKRISELEHIMAKLIQDNKHLEERLGSHGDLPESDIKEILYQIMWETNSYKTHEDHMMLYKALEMSMNRDHAEELLKDLAEVRKKKKKRRDSPKTPPGSPPHQPPPPPPPADPFGTSGSPGASGSSQVPPPPPSPPSTNQEVHAFDDEDIENTYIPKVNLRQDWWKPLEEDRPATPEPAWYILSSDVHVPKNNWVSALASTYSPSPNDSLLTHTSEGDRRAVRTHMRILSVVRIEVFSVYGYDYMKKVVLRRADLNEPISHLNHLPPKDKKILTTIVNLWTRHLVIRQRVEDFQLGIKSYQTQFNLTKPRWDTTGFEYKHDYTIDEALDYRVKEFKVNKMNPSLNTRFWTRKDVDRSKEFMFSIQKRLKNRRIFRNLESFVGGRVKDGDYRHLKLTE
nr:hypothetical protein [Tanacetum cinerariifolium]